MPLENAMNPALTTTRDFDSNCNEAYSERETASGLTWRGEGAARWPAAV
jgi:hypothetical protein